MKRRKALNPLPFSLKECEGKNEMIWQGEQCKRGAVPEGKAHDEFLRS